MNEKEAVYTNDGKQIIDVRQMLARDLAQDEVRFAFKSVDLTDDTSGKVTMQAGEYLIGFNAYFQDDAGNTGYDLFFFEMKFGGTNFDFFDGKIIPAQFISDLAPVWKLPTPEYFPKQRDVNVSRDYFGPGNITYLKVFFLCAVQCK